MWEIAEQFCVPEYKVGKQFKYPLIINQIILKKGLELLILMEEFINQ